MSKEARKVMEEEIAKLSTLESSSAEFNVTRNYLDWIVNLPWGLKTTESYNLAFAKEASPHCYRTCMSNSSMNV